MPALFRQRFFHRQVDKFRLLRADSRPHGDVFLVLNECDKFKPMRFLQAQSAFRGSRRNHRKVGR